MLIAARFPYQEVDSQVLHVYNVTQDDVLNKFNTITNNFKNIKPRVKEGRYVCEANGSFQSSVDFGVDKESKFALSVIVFFRNSGTHKCTHCRKEKKYTKNYRIINTENHRKNQEKWGQKNSNKNNDEEIIFSNIALHYLKRHLDFGIPGSYRINPTQICRVFNLGNTYLKENDPLFEVVKYLNWGADQKAQKRTDDEALEKLGSSAKEVADVINDLITQKDKTYKKVLSKDGRFEINWFPCFSTTPCDLCEPEIEVGDGSGTITNLETKTTLKINGLWIHSVSYHGYFAINVNSRVEPIFAYNVLDLKCIKAL